jgi:succinate dehydrogenase/fumarate reductase iron-sulfur protein
MILVTGAKGMLGTDLCAELSSQHQVTGVDLGDFDLSHKEAVEAIADLNPQLVVHCAAMTNVDGCETDPDRAYLVNGLGTRHAALACQKLVKDYGGGEIVLEPLPTFRVIKDLIVDLDPFFEKVNEVRPYLISSDPPKEKERRQSQEDSRRVSEAIRCILCACCTAACPVVAENERYLGPAPLVWAFRYIFDSRDEQTVERLKGVDHPDGVWGCVNYFECTRVCPKEIPVTKCINTIKREIEKGKTKNRNNHENTKQ